MVNVFFLFLFSSKIRTKIEISTSHLFIFTPQLKNCYIEITTATQSFIYNFTDQLHYYEHFSRHSLKDCCELRHLVFDVQAFH